MVADLGPVEGSWKASVSWQMAGVRGAEVSITPLEVVSFSVQKFLSLPETQFILQAASVAREALRNGPESVPETGSQRERCLVSKEKEVLSPRT